MTLTELRYIVAVAQKKHFGQAAQACFVSQPTLSIAIKKLEDELDIKLFERSSKNAIRVTEIGQRIIDQAHRVLRETQVINEIAQQGKDPLSGSFRLGAIYTIGPYLLPDLIPRISHSAPKLKLIIEENFTAALTEKLKNGDLDIILIAEPYSEPGIQTRALYSEPFVALLPAGHALAEKAVLDTTDLAHETVLLLGSGHCFRDQVLEFCPECRRQTSLLGNAIQNSIEGGSLETLRLIAQGLTNHDIAEKLTISPMSARCLLDQIQRASFHLFKDASHILADQADEEKH